jgi:hypothetical protein
MGCHCANPAVETCEIGIGPSCEELGYYGGTVGCAPTCLASDPVPCDACGPDTLACTKTNFPSLSTPNVVVSGSHVGVASRGVHIFDGVDFVVTPHLYTQVLAPVPAGWVAFVQVSLALVTVDLDGTLGTPHPVLIDGKFPSMSSTGDHVLLAWTPDGSTQTRFAIADASGNQVVPATDLFGDGEQFPAATTDGTSFFVAGGGHLARVSPDGTHTVIDGYPVDDTNHATWLTWSGTTGWYVVRGAGDALVAQRFDSNGAIVGGAIPIDVGETVTDVEADGEDLVICWTSSDGKLHAARVDALGAVGTPVEVGVTAGIGEVRDIPQLTHLGVQILVAWIRHGPRGFALQLATIAPP